MRLAAQKQTLFSMLQIKTIPKNVSTSTSWTFSFIYLTTISEGSYKLSEETTQRKHTHVTTLFLAKHKQIFFFAKKIATKLILQVLSCTHAARLSFYLSFLFFLSAVLFPVKGFVFFFVKINLYTHKQDIEIDSSERSNSQKHRLIFAKSNRTEQWLVVVTKKRFKLVVEIFFKAVNTIVHSTRNWVIYKWYAPEANFFSLVTFISLIVLIVLRFCLQINLLFHLIQISLFLFHTYESSSE